MLTSTVELAALAVLVALLAYAGTAFLKPRAGTAVLLSVLLIVAALPLRSHAFELRKSDGATTVGRPNEVGSKAAKDLNIPVSTIAFGTDHGSIQIPGEDRQVSVPVDAAVQPRPRDHSHVSAHAVLPA